MYSWYCDIFIALVALSLALAMSFSPSKVCCLFACFNLFYLKYEKIKES